MAKETDIQSPTDMAQENVEKKDDISQIAMPQAMQEGDAPQDAASSSFDLNVSSAPNLDISSENLDTGIEVNVNTGISEATGGENTVINPFDFNNVFEGGGFENNAHYYQSGMGIGSEEQIDDISGPGSFNGNPAGFGSGGFSESDAALDRFQWGADSFEPTGERYDARHDFNFAQITEVTGHLPGLQASPGDILPVNSMRQFYSDNNFSGSNTHIEFIKFDGLHSNKGPSDNADAYNFYETAIQGPAFTGFLDIGGYKITTSHTFEFYSQGPIYTYYQEYYFTSTGSDDGGTINQSPVVEDTSIEGTEDTNVNFLATHFTDNYSDPEGVTLNAVRIESLPGSGGTLKVNGNNINVGQDIAFSDLGNLSFVPSSNWNGNTNFTWRGYDGSNYSNLSTFTISIAAVNDAPVLDLDSGAAGIDYAASFTEGGEAVAIVDSSQLTLSDVDDTQIESATVTITNKQDGDAESLSATTDGTNITAEYDVGTGVLTLSGADTVSNYQTVLQTVTYNNTSNDPDATARTVNFIVNDGTSNSEAAVSTVTINAVNDAPTILNFAGGNPTFTENGGAIALDVGGDATVDDVDNTDYNGGYLDIANTNGTSNDTLSVAETGGITLNGSEVLYNGNAIGDIHATDDGASGKDLRITFDSASANDTSVAALIRAIRFNNSSEAPDATTRTIRFTLNDGGTTSDNYDVSVTMAAVNDAPVISAASPSLTSINEDATGGGHAVSSIVGNSISDADSSAVEGIAIYATVGNGTWQYTTDGTNWSNVGSVSATSALLLKANDANHQIRYVGDGENAETATFSYYAWDQTSGTAGTKVNVSSRGDATAFSTASDTTSITVTAINDAPINAVPDAQSTDKNTNLVLSGDNSNQISVSDVDVGSDEVEMTLSVTNGALTLASTTGLTFTTGDGTADATMVFTGTVSNVNTALDGLTYIPTTDFTGEAVISITTNDQGGTGGEPESDTDNVTITVTGGVNSVPVIDLNGDGAGTGYSGTFTEAGGAIAMVDSSNLTVSDADGDNIKSATITITNALDKELESISFTGSDENITIGSYSYNTSTGQGSVTLTGTASAADYQALLRTMQYNNTSEKPAGADRTINISVTDANDGVSTAAVSTMSVTQSGGFDATNLSNGEGSTGDGFEIIGASGSGFGYAVSEIGDFNGDGYGDILIGAPNSTNGDAYVVFGAASGFGGSLNVSALDGSNGFKIAGVNSSGKLGISVSSAGDINGDGYTDLIVGASGYNSESGETYIVYGTNADMGATFDISADNLNGATNGFRFYSTELDSSPANMGISVHTIGDINQDGYDDVIAGAYASNEQRGEAYVLYGSSSFDTNIDVASLDGSNGFQLVGIDAWTDQTGYSVSGGGDFNNDGVADFIIGAGRHNANNGAGEIYLLYGDTDFSSGTLNLSDLDGANGFTLYGVDDWADRAGYSVDFAGDVNGDGIDDLIIGAYQADGVSNANNNAGEAYVVFGQNGFSDATFNLSTLDGTNGFTLTGLTQDDFGGFSVSQAGDVDGDGYDDILVGTGSLNGTDTPSLTNVFLIYGGSSFNSTIDLDNMDASTGFSITAASSAPTEAGLVVNAGGDINGDGYDDIMVGNSDGDEAYVIFGKDFRGLVTDAGTPGADELTISASDAIAQSGAGADTISVTGAVSDVVINAGGGDDTIKFDTLSSITNALDIDGGYGTDLLVFEGANATISSSTLSQLSNIERIDITGSGNNTLNLTVADVLSLSSSTNEIYVDGNNGDTANLSGSGWSQDQTGVSAFSNTYDSYVNSSSAEVVYVDQDVTINLNT